MATKGLAGNSHIYLLWFWGQKLTGSDWVNGKVWEGLVPSEGSRGESVLTDLRSQTGDGVST